MNAIAKNTDTGTNTARWTGDIERKGEERNETRVRSHLTRLSMLLMSNTSTTTDDVLSGPHRMLNSESNPVQ